MIKNFNKSIEDLDGFETDYVKLMYYDLSENFSGTYKTYDYPRFCTILNGRKEVLLDDNTKLTYNKNNYLLLPANSNVKMNISMNTTALVFELNQKLIKNVINKIKLPDDIKNNIDYTKDYFLGDNSHNISDDIQNLIFASKQKDYSGEFLIDLYAQKLVLDLVKNKTTYSILNTNNNHPISIAVKYIDKNIECTINIKNLAKQLYMSESNFCNLFKKLMGLKPSEYIKNKKLDVALQLLEKESVTDVAFTLGYSNISYFIKLFKDKYKLTPKQYKLNCIN